MESEVLGWFVAEGLPIVVAFKIGVIFTFMFMKLTISQQIEFLKKELKRSDESCDKRMQAMEKKHDRDMELILETNRSNDRRIMAILNVIAKKEVS